MSHRKPHNPNHVPACVHLAEAMSVGADASILRQEAQGQTSLVESDTIPTKFLGNQDEVRRTLEEAGVMFHGVVEDDPMFQYVTLPDGWVKRATGHPLWSDLVDDQGQVRAMIFYKAAFYDRSAHLQLA